MSLPNRQTVLIKNALVITMNDAGDVHERADVLVKDGRIAEIGRIDPGAHPGLDREIDASDRLLVPGFVNAHSHSAMHIQPGTVDGANHPAFMWLNQAVTSDRTYRENYVAAMLGCYQMLTTGTTSCIDHYPEQNLELDDVEAVVRAYEDSGMRAVVALRVYDELYDDILPGGKPLPQELLELVADFKVANPALAKSADELAELCDRNIARWNGRDGRIHLFPAPSNPTRCSDEMLVHCRNLAEKYDVGIHMHLLESEVQRVIAQRKYNRSVVERMDDLGLLSPRLTCAHSNWVTEADIERMGRTGTVVAHNPESNLKLGTGITPIPEMLRHGVPIALGTDGVNHNDNLILHDAMRLVCILRRPSEPDRSKWIVARDALRMATRGGAAAMYQADTIGSIEVGKKADLVLYDLSAPWWIPLNDPVQQLVHGENGSSVDTVLVDGRILVDGRKFLAFDADAIKEEARGMLRDIRTRNPGLTSTADRLSAMF
jgi:cytosine/adenosine deaminase-related metal-dependent hydrolase